MKKTASNTVSKTVIGSIAVCGALIASIYFAPNIYQHFKMRYTNADREVFKQSVTYNEGMLDDIAKYHYEYTQADEVGKKAIASLVRSRFANFDKSKIENIDLIKFLEECGV